MVSLGAWPEKSFDLLVLTFVAGMLDALAYLRGHAFIANMTGNTVLLGLGLMGAHRERALSCLVALGGFLVGSAIGALTLTRETAARDEASDLRTGIALELGALALICTVWATFPGADAHSAAVSFMLAGGGCALGIQSVAIRRLKIAGVATTFITGTMTTAVVELISRRKRAKDAGDSNPLLLAAMFFTYILAAICGVFAYDRAHRFACFVPLAGAALVVVRQWRNQVRSAGGS